jgi:hypothetical protein
MAHHLKMGTFTIYTIFRNVFLLLGAFAYLLLGTPQCWAQAVLSGATLNGYAANTSSTAVTTIARAWTSAEVNNVGATTMTFTIPGGQSAAVGDLLVVLINAQRSTFAPPSESGVTWEKKAFLGFGTFSYIFTGKVTATQNTGTTFTFTSTNGWNNGIMANYTGVDISRVNDAVQMVSNNLGAGAEATSADISGTLTYRGDMVIVFGSTVNSSQTYTLPGGGFSTILDDGSNQLWAVDQVYTASGATGTISASWTTLDDYGIILFPLKALGS